MTVLRGGWGVLLPRRQQGLSKMMAYSIFLHLFLFLFIILNRAFFSSRTTSFDGFQVNLVGSGSGGGLTSGAAPKPRASKKPTKTPQKKSAKVQIKTPPVVKKTSPKQAAPKVAPAKAAVKSVSPVPQSPSKADSPLTRAPRRSVNAPPPEKEDPERLQEWWKKQKKALKTPSTTPGIKPKMGISERTRTAKIDIQKRPAPVTPLVSPPKAAPKTAPPSAESVPEKQETPEIDTSQKTGDSSPSTENFPEEPLLPNRGDREGSQIEEDASLQASLGPGITGVGPSGGNSSFLFPNYLQKVDHKIRWRWAPPPVTSSGDRLVIRFVIQKSGGIDKSSVEIAESSGNLFFDQAAIRAIHAANPLPPLPRAYTEEVLIVFMNFVVREDS